MDVILAVDQSTSATKGLVFSLDGRVIDRVSLDHAQIYPQAGWVEHDPEKIYHNTVQVLQELVRRHADKTFHCLSITNQRETFVIFERATGKPLYNAIVWQCRRGEPRCQEWIEAGYEAKVHHITGLKIDTYFPASKMAWLLDAQPEIAQKVQTGEALIGTIDAYLIYRLTEGRVFASDPTNACRTLLFDIQTRTWSAELCDLFAIPIHALPEIRDCSAHFGDTLLDGALTAPLPIMGVMGDSQAALFAEQCFDAGDAKVTFGTGSSVLLNIGDHPQHSGAGVVTTIGWVHDNTPTYAYEGIINFTGATIAWMRDQMRYIQTPEETETLALAVPDNGGVYLVPAFVGLSAPYWKPNAKAGILGLTPASTREHIVRAALESIAYQVKDVLELMQAETGISLQFIHADGGMVNNRFLMQFVADMTGIVVRASRLPDLSPLGAVMAGLLGMGNFSTIQSLRALPHDFVDYHPQMSSAQRDRNYQGWKNAVQQVIFVP